MKEKINSDILNQIYPIGTIFPIIQKYKGQEIDDLNKLNSMIGKWEKYGEDLYCIYYIRKK